MAVVDATLGEFEQVVLLESSDSATMRTPYRSATRSSGARDATSPADRNLHHARPPRAQRLPAIAARRPDARAGRTRKRCYVLRPHAAVEDLKGSRAPSSACGAGLEGVLAMNQPAARRRQRCCQPNACRAICCSDRRRSPRAEPARVRAAGPRRTHRSAGCERRLVRVRSSGGSACLAAGVPGCETESRA